MQRIPSIRASAVLMIVAWLSAPAATLAWRSTGHMVTAQIAYDELEATARREVDRLVAVFSEHSPYDDAVTASLWADHLKQVGVEAFDRWHYINLPLSSGFRGPVPESAADNVVWAIEQASAALRGPADDLAKAWMLHFLLHLVGDIHQPLHCVSRYSRQHPEGDRGGNDFLLSGKHPQLHAFWDFGADLFPDLDGKDWATQGRALTDSITGAVPKRAVPRWQRSAPKVWAEEGQRLAKEVVYAGIEEGTEPSAEYKARAQQTIQR
ncbi:MAG: S1/P1 nuclease, partial [Acidobacteriota bacterium]